MLSPWESRHFHAEPQLAVVGAGIVGLFAALFYKRAHPSHHVLVLERGPYPSGASVKNAGFACFGSPSELLADIEKEGLDAALARVEMRWKGLLNLRAELGDHQIGFEPTGGHEVYRAHDPLYTRVLEKFDALNDSLLPFFKKPVYRWNGDGPRSFGLAPALKMATTDLEGAVDTGAMMRTLLQKAQAEGVLVRTNALVKAIDEKTDHVRIQLADGTELKAGHVLLATNGFTPQLAPDLDVIPARAQVLLTEPIGSLQLKGTFHFDEGFYYFRDLGGAVLLGGARNLNIEGETTAEEGTTEQIQNALENLLREIILPGKEFRIAKRWSGIMAMGATSKAPLIERIGERTTVAVRLGGMGVAIGIEVAKQTVRSI